MNVCLFPDAQPRLRLCEGIYSLSSHPTRFIELHTAPQVPPHRGRRSQRYEARILISSRNRLPFSESVLYPNHI